MTLRHSGQSATFRTLDLSVLGCRIGEAPSLPVGSLLRLSFSLPDDLAEFPIVTWAQVVSFTPAPPEGGQLGLKFVGLRACDARRLGRYLLHHAGGDTDEETVSTTGAPYPF